MPKGLATTRIRRTAATVAAAVVLLMPSLVAYADDPEPPAWPEVEQPNSGGGSADPQPVDWPAPEPL